VACRQRSWEEEQSERDGGSANPSEGSAQNRSNDYWKHHRALISWQSATNDQVVQIFEGQGGCKCEKESCGGVIH
jgi:hypothetical protein